MYLYSPAALSVVPESLFPVVLFPPELDDFLFLSSGSFLIFLMIPVDEEARFINLFCKKGGLDTLDECSSRRATMNRNGKSDLVYVWGERLLRYRTRAIISRGLYFCPPFFTAANIVELLILQSG